MKLLSTVVLASAVSVSSAFVSSTRFATSTFVETQPSPNNDEQIDLMTVLRMSNDDGKDAGSGPFGGFNPFKEIADMFQNLDDGELNGRCLAWCCDQLPNRKWFLYFRPR